MNHSFKINNNQNSSDGIFVCNKLPQGIIIKKDYSVFPVDSFNDLINPEKNEFFCNVNEVESFFKYTTVNINTLILEENFLQTLLNSYNKTTDNQQKTKLLMLFVTICDKCSIEFHLKLINSQFMEYLESAFASGNEYLIEISFYLYYIFMKYPDFNLNNFDFNIFINLSKSDNFKNEIYHIIKSCIIREDINAELIDMFIDILSTYHSNKSIDKYFFKTASCLAKFDRFYETSIYKFCVKYINDFKSDEAKAYSSLLLKLSEHDITCIQNYKESLIHYYSSNIYNIKVINNFAKIIQNHHFEYREKYTYEDQINIITISIEKLTKYTAHHKDIRELLWYIFSQIQSVHHRDIIEKGVFDHICSLLIYDDSDNIEVIIEIIETICSSIIKHNNDINIGNYIKVPDFIKDCLDKIIESNTPLSYKAEKIQKYIFG